MSKLFLEIFNISIAASWLIAAVLIMRFALKNRAPRWIACLLWAAVGLRLLVPFSFESNFGLVPSRETINPDAVYGEVSVPADESLPDENSTPVIGDTENSSPVTDNSYPVTDPGENSSPVIGDVSNGSLDNTPVKPKPPVTDTKPPQYIQSGIGAIDDKLNPMIQNRVEDSSEQNEENPLQKTIDTAAYIWLAGMAGMLIYAVVNYLLLKRRIAEAIPEGKLIRRCDAVGSPFILGIIKPKIYLPFGLSNETENHIIAHESAHLKRRDHWIKPFGYAVLAVYWFNPLVWVAYIMLCRDIEIACDEKVVANMSAEARKAYASALLECGIKRSVIAACPVAFGEIGVKQRVKNALSYKKPVLWIIISAIIISALVLVAFLTSPNGNVNDPSEESSTPNENSDPLVPNKTPRQLNPVWTAYEGTIYPGNPIHIADGNTGGLSVIDDYEKLQTFINNSDGDQEYLNSISESFFEDNILLAVKLRMDDSVLRRIPYINGVTADIDSKKVTLNISYEDSDDVLDLIPHPSYVLIAELSREDILGDPEFTVKITKGSGISGESIEFTQHTFDGQLESYSYEKFVHAEWIHEINDRTELNQLLAEYVYSGYGDDLNEFASGLAEDFFDSKTLYAIPMFSRETLIGFEATDVRVDSERVTAYLSAEDWDRYLGNYRWYIVLIEVKSADKAELDFAVNVESKAPAGIPVLPTREERKNADEEYINTVTDGGREFTYEELISMSKDEIKEIVFMPAMELYGRVDGFTTTIASDDIHILWDPESGINTDIYIVDPDLFPSYESFVAELRKYFSQDITASLMDGRYFEHDGLLLIEEGQKGVNPSLYKVEFEIASHSTTEIVYHAIQYIFKDNSNKNLDPSEMTDDMFELEYYECILSNINGKWVLTQFAGSKIDPPTVDPEDGNIEFNASSMPGSLTYNGDEVDNLTAVRIDNESELARFIAQYFAEESYSLAEFEKFTETLPDGYFDKNSLIIFNTIAFSGDIDISVESASIKNNDVIIDVLYDIPHGTTDYMQYRIFAVEVEKSEIANVKGITLSAEHKYPNGTVHKEQRCFDENGRLTSSYYEKYDANGTETEGKSDIYREDGMIQHQEKENGRIVKDTLIKGEETVMEETFTYVESGSYETRTVYYMNGKIHHIKEHVLSDIIDPALEWDNYIDKTYDAEGNLLEYNTFKKEYHPLADGRLVQIRMDDPTDEWGIKLLLGEGDDSELVAEMILYGEDYEYFRFVSFGEGWNESTATELYNDYLEHREKNDAFLDEWSTYVYGE